MKNKIIIVEDDIVFSKLLLSFLTNQGYDVEVCHSIRSGKEAISSHAPHLVLLDYRLPDGTGYDLLNFLNERKTGIPVIIMTSFNDVNTAVKSIKAGAADYILKPVNPDELLLVIQKVLNPQQNKILKNIPAADDVDYIDGESESSLELKKITELIAPTNMSIIIQGESGTGKEYIAKKIHSLSKRKDKPFIAIDCGSLTKELASSELFGHVKGSFTGAVNDKTGQFENADGGTLFLDEIGNLSYDIQIKLLRVLQERIVQPIGSNKSVKVDIRLIVATNDNLTNSMKENIFREDLYHRLNEFSITTTPLRERGNDLFLFADYFIKQSCKELNKEVLYLSEASKELFRLYEWPGNIRELKNIIRRAVLLSNTDLIEPESLPEEMRYYKKKEEAYKNDLKKVNEEYEKELITKIMLQVKYNKTKAAKLLNIDRKTLYVKLEKYNIL